MLIKRLPRTKFSAVMLLPMVAACLADAAEKVSPMKNQGFASYQKFKPFETILGTATLIQRHPEVDILQFSNGAKKEIGDYATISFLKTELPARILIVKVSKDDKEFPVADYCNVNFFLLDLTLTNPFLPGLLDDACYDQNWPTFQKEGDKYVIQFTSSIDFAGYRQPNVKYIYEKSKLTAEIRDPKTQKVTVKHKN